jgi:6-phosphogluconolactonase
MMETRVDMHVYQTSADFETGAAEEIAGVLNGAISERGKCFVALSGGETPRQIYRRLAMDPLKSRVKWKQVNLFFSDERCVPPTAPESNYGMAEESLISSIDIPRGNIHRMKGEIDPTEAAREYQQEIRSAFGGQPVRFDLVILGIGVDGHTASIFPGSPVVEEEHALVCPASAPDQKLHRLTLTFSCINSARKIIFLAAGKKKAQIVQRVLGTSKPLKEFPATMVQPPEGKVTWLLDRDAASLVQSSDGQVAGSS